ncbi:hypothetical protein [Sphingomonas sanxanigenens]|uniref:N-acetyltransferase domain-containing protein n=1 Tax=Sphingomonas sanxanigenens DSM 19645 = NX02 TaxID=1123269 RepID=W0AA96_9SPHN|nr:hypothetical protein [Sphingomonas sanxanigenens]AHE53996.1 hypothetical protein NX02_11425 [Sphingomonas sanxanigenens DSM 19645 = NX02]
MEIEGVSFDALKALPTEDLEALLAFGRPITFRMGTATVLAEFNKLGDDLIVNLAHIDGGGEGVLVSLWKLVAGYAKERGYPGICWNVHALTCADPNPRLQRFLRTQGFEETSSEQYGRVLTLRRAL